ncbi:MAG: helicase-associated domain-containing protein, partial [Planctomycetota bacterium]
SAAQPSAAQPSAAQPSAADRGHPDLRGTVALLASAAEIEHRRSLLPATLQGVFDVAVWRHGGFLPKTVYDKVRPRLPRWDHTSLKEGLEAACLGTVRHLALGEYGINHFDDTLIIFQEVTAAALASLPGPERALPDEIRGFGVDLISDISSFLSFVGHTKMRLTLNGNIYRTAVKKAGEHFILNKKEEFGEREVFELIHSFCLAKKLIQQRGDRSLALTIKGRSWETMPLEKKLKMLLSYATEECDSGVERFHTPRVRKAVLGELGRMALDRWYDANMIPWTARNAYLVGLDELGVRDAFQNRYQYTTNTAMRDPSQLAQCAASWLRNRLSLLGLVDFAYAAGRRVQMRLTALGARALGWQIDRDETAGQKPLVVNPDFEVIVFPDGDLYELVCKLDRFCERLKSGTAYHYRISCPSVEKAIAQGMTAAEILTILSEHARVDIPQNVIYSIREWAETVKFVAVQRVTVLRARNKEVVERILHRPSLRALVRERLAPTVLLLADDADHAELVRRLEKIGVFIDEKGVASNGGVAPNGGGTSNGSERDED